MPLGSSRLLPALILAAVERVEVIRGPTAISGDGATGRIINLITRAPGEGPVRFSTTFGTQRSLPHPGNSVGGTLAQTAAGKRGLFDYALSGAFEYIGGFLDAEGDVIAPDPHGHGGLADVNTFNLFGKFGVGLGSQCLQLTVKHFETDEATDFTTDPSVDAVPYNEAVKARALSELQLEDDQGVKNTVVSLDHSHPVVFGSRIHGQVYYRDSLTRLFHDDGRNFAGLGRSIIQSRVESEKVGGPLELHTPLPQRLRLTAPWGLDLSHEKTLPPVAQLNLGLTIKWVASWRRILFDLHRVAGTYPLILLVIVALTGAAMQFPLLVLRPEDSVLVVKRFPDEIGQYGRSYVWLDQYSGTTLRVEDNRLALSILFGTSLAMWWNRRRAARRARARQLHMEMHAVAVKPP